MNYPIEMLVRMSDSAKNYYTESFRNPFDEVGKITSCRILNAGDTGYVYTVRWSNDQSNSYRKIDLTPVALTEKTFEDYL